MPGASSERALILAPIGRDASVAAALIGEAGFEAGICDDIAALTREIAGGAGLAVIAPEAGTTADLRRLDFGFAFGSGSGLRSSAVSRLPAAAASSSSGSSSFGVSSS